MTAAGLQVVVDMDGPAHRTALPVGIELSAYRIVQEALTNTLKHAGPGTTARVDVRRSASALEITIADDGRTGQPGGEPHHGHGLLGMRERVNLLGGELRVGPRAGGGFTVRAWFPLAATAEASA